MRPWYNTQQQGKPESKRFATQERKKSHQEAKEALEKDGQWAQVIRVRLPCFNYDTSQQRAASKHRAACNERADDREQTYHRFFPETQTTKRAEQRQL